MLRATLEKGNLKKSRQQKYGLRSVASLLGVTAGHLSRVKRGLRTSPDLLSRYHRIIKSNGGVR